MTSNDRPNDQTYETTDDGAPRRSLRLNELMETRSYLAIRAARQRSHDMVQAQDAFGLQLLLETMIRDEFPEDYDRISGAWIAGDASHEHPQGVVTADCSFCCAF